jgi:hypothetical protein
MKLNDVESKLLNGMLESFAKHGFVLNKQDHAYKRIIDRGVQKFYLLFFKKQDGIYIEPRWSIKLDAILDIYHMVAAKEKKYFKFTPVLENSLGELIEFTDNGNERGSGKNMQYLIEDDNDIDILIKVIPKRFEEYVLPYFILNSSVEKVDKLLNVNPRELTVHNWLYPSRACMGIIAAILTNNPRYVELVNTYEQELQDANPTYKKEFEDLVALLNERYSSTQVH